MATTGQGRRQSVTVVPQTQSPLLDAFTFDLTRSMRISYAGTATQHPVQNGAEGPVDQLIVAPAEVQVTGVTGNTPVQSLSGLESVLLNVQEAGSDRMVSLTEIIVRLHQLKVLCTVLCSWNAPLYNYWPEVIDLSRDQGSGNTISKTVSFKKIRIVNSQVVPTVQDSDILALAQSRLEFGPVAFE